MAIRRYKGQPLPIIIQYDSDPLVPYNKTMSDITDVTMNIKKNTGSDTDAQYLEKKQSVSSGVTIDANEFTFQMNIGEGDYTNLVAGELYSLVLAVEIAGFTNYIELPIDNESKKVYILNDENRS